MKNQQCFLTAFLISIVMTVWYNVFFLKLLGDESDIIKHGGLGLFLLQGVIGVKYISCSVLAMPAEVRLRQVVAGYFSADILINLLFLFDKSSYSFPLEIIILQIIYLTVLIISERRISRTSFYAPWEETRAKVSFRKSEISPLGTSRNSDSIKRQRPTLTPTA